MSALSLFWLKEKPRKDSSSRPAGESGICLKTVTGDCPEISEQAGGAFGRLLEEVARDKVDSGTDEVGGFGDVF